MSIVKVPAGDEGLLGYCRAIAQAHAKCDQEHEYTKVEGFEPHEWVVLAIYDAYRRGVTDAQQGQHP